MPGQAVNFSCSVSGGQTPYTYNWTSNIDGVLSTSQSFSISDLSAAKRNNSVVPHTITVVVRDDNGLVSSDSITITVAAPTPASPLAIAGVVGLVVLLTAAVLLRRRRGKALAFLPLLMLLPFLALLPLTYANPLAASTNPANPDSTVRSLGDDSANEVGIEWVGPSVGLPNSGINSGGFYNWLGDWGGFTCVFNWGDYDAWEQDFRYVSIGGDDVNWVDAVDFVYYQDHGCPWGVEFSSMHTDTWLYPTECMWGDGDLEWIVLDACSPLALDDGGGYDVFERWGGTLQGVHMICSFATGSLNVETRGVDFGMHLTGFPYILPMGITMIGAHRIIDAWFAACADTEGDACWAAVLYSTKSADPWNPQLDDPINDYLTGFGHVCNDPVPANWWAWIANQC